MEYKVEKFIYNGMFVHPEEGEAPYTAKFLRWTNDPGVAECECSDGEMRLIPSCQLLGFKIGDVPEQPKPKPFKGVLVGHPSKS